MSDEIVRQALALLEEAGSLDLLAPAARPHARPVRRAAAGVAASMLAWSSHGEEQFRSREHGGKAAKIGVEGMGMLSSGILCGGKPGWGVEVVDLGGEGLEVFGRFKSSIPGPFSFPSSQQVMADTIQDSRELRTAQDP
ncbi:hypothetical protein NDU88_002134 [Pleurodeles waltl]|uniref:Uncharacterized protein n=1 Tax=Pleurodeles waltl TaxID=8319 RepID=A0AAV7TME3_PLEWA|nr:hypothetical protein NDU88_002134 [Pleurodeles waltl]